MEASHLVRLLATPDVWGQAVGVTVAGQVFKLQRPCHDSTRSKRSLASLQPLFTVVPASFQSKLVMHPSFSS